MPELSRKELASSYGWALATLKSIPELNRLFNRAVKKSYTPDKFIAEMRETNWFKRSSESQRKFIVLKTADPGQYVSQVRQVMQSLADKYSQATGQVMPLRPPRIKNGRVVDGGGFIYQAAVQSLQMGLNEAQINDLIFKGVNWERKIAKDQLGGELSSQLQNLRQAAMSLGVKPSDRWYALQIDKIADGNDTVDGAIGQLKKLSAQRYGAFAEQIEAGQSVAEIAEGYRQSMAQVLELNPGEIDVFDRSIQRALTARDEKGQPQAMSINDFEDSLRRDTRWQYTQNAKETLLTRGQDLLKSFGLVG